MRVTGPLRHVKSTSTLRGRRVMETLPLLNTLHVTFRKIRPPFTRPEVTDVHETARSGRFLVRNQEGVEVTQKVY
jgi:hypothetical protein